MLMKMMDDLLGREDITFEEYMLTRMLMRSTVNLISNGEVGTLEILNTIAEEYFKRRGPGDRHRALLSECQDSDYPVLSQKFDWKFEPGGA